MDFKIKRFKKVQIIDKFESNFIGKSVYSFALYGSGKAARADLISLASQLKSIREKTEQCVDISQISVLL